VESAIQRAKGVISLSSPTTSTAPVRLQIANGVATIVLNRPDQYNAVSTALGEMLLAALAKVRDDDAARAVVLTGAGDDFCSGADLSERAALLADGDTAGLRAAAERLNAITRLLATMPKPVIAAVNGLAAGAGAAFALAADLRMAASTAQFLIASANTAAPLDAGVSWLLPRLIGHARASALALLAEPVAADQALTMGLVNAAVPAKRVLASATELAERFSRGPTAAYAAIKEQLAFSATATLEESLAHETEALTATISSPDHRAAIDAFVNGGDLSSFTGR
jgi:2-(1,2-epoxy-1,2-dihydrophenyl)acetyl-CoA isomerase